MPNPLARIYLCLIAVVILVPLAGCNAAAPPPNRVVVFGAIHSGHRTSDRYSTGVLRDAIRAIKPDLILCEIPPSRVAVALAQYDATEQITEPRVRVFPEYVDVIIPLRGELGFEIIGCAAWTQEMANDRREKLTRWQSERPGETREVNAAQRATSQAITNAGWDDDPLGIHTPQYDEFIRQGMEPYNRLFNDDLGPGGWDNINAGHYAYIEQALDANTGEGLTVLIIFGSGHKYWFLDQLQQRDDIELMDPRQFFIP